jgi:hypothetical protein
MYARGAYAPKAERERIMNLVRDARPGSTLTQPPDYRLRRQRPERAPAARLMRGGLAEARSRKRDDELEDDGSPIQQSLF